MNGGRYLTRYECHQKKAVYYPISSLKKGELFQQIKERYSYASVRISSIKNKKNSVKERSNGFKTIFNNESQSLDLPDISKTTRTNRRWQKRQVNLQRQSISIPLKPIPKPINRNTTMFGWKTQNQSFFNNQYLTIQKSGRSYSRIQDKSNDQWLYLLRQLKNILKNSQEILQILPSSFWPYLIQKFQKYHTFVDERIQLLQLISKFFEKDFGFSIHKDNFEFSEEIGKKFQRLQNIIFFKHKQCLHQMKFLIDPFTHKQRFFKVYFCEFKFNLEEEQVFQIFQIVRTFCQNNMDAFAFITLYFQISLNKKIKSEEFNKVQKEFSAILDKVTKKYPPNQQQSDDNKVNYGFQSYKAKFEFQTIRFSDNGKSHFQQLREKIIQKAEQAKSQSTLYRQLIQDICYKYGYSLKTDLKIKSANEHSSIFRTIEKILTKQDKFKNEFEILKHKLHQDGSLKDKNLWLKVKLEIQEVQKKFQEILESQSSVVFDSKDLIRGKCTFSKIQEIVETAQLLKQNLSQNGHQIIQVKNRLNFHTKDIVLIIKLPKSVAQLQLALKLDSVSNEFAHKIYQITRSELYTLITNLFVHNQKWSEKFFINEFQIFESVREMQRQPDLQDKITFKRLTKDIHQFKKNYLQPNNVKYEKDFSRKMVEKVKVIDKFKEVKDIILKTKQTYSKITKNQKHQKEKQQNLMNFCKSFDYEKALEHFESIQQQQLYTNLRLMKVKADVLRQHGQYPESLRLYSKYVEIQIPSNKIDNTLAQVFHCIGLIHDIKQQFIKAIENYEKQRLTLQKINGENSIKVSDSLTGIGQVYSHMKTKQYYQKALEYHTKALKIREQSLGIQHIDTASSLNYIGVVYRRKGILEKKKKERQHNLNKALQLHTQAFTITFKILGRESLQAATCLYNMGIAYYYKNNGKKALHYLNNALEIRQKILGKQSADVAKTLQYISYVYESLNYLEKAHTSIECAYLIFKKILTEDHADTRLSFEQKTDLKQKIEKKQKDEMTSSLMRMSALSSYA